MTVPLAGFLYGLHRNLLLCDSLCPAGAALYVKTPLYVKAKVEYVPVDYFIVGPLNAELAGIFGASFAFANLSLIHI